MTLDDALGQPGRLVAAWDGSSIGTALDVFVTSEHGAKRIHHEDVKPEQREAVAERVRERGVRLGGARSTAGLVWVFDDRGVGVWSAEASLVEGSAMVVGLRGGAVKARDIRKVLTVVDPNDATRRGVRCELPTGNQVAFVEEQHADKQWATALGQDLAMWLGVPHLDPKGDVTNASQLEVATASRELADQIGRLPETGVFEHVIQVIGTFAPHGKLQYRYAPNPMDDAKRFLELRLFTPSDKSSWARWVKQGTNEQVGAFLRDLRTPSAILNHMEEMARKLAQEQYV